MTKRAKNLLWIVVILIAKVRKILKKAGLK